MTTSVRQSKELTAKDRKRNEPTRVDAAPGAVGTLAVEREIRFLPGLPYGSWQEVPIVPLGPEWRLLSVEEEQLLFRQLNLAYYRAVPLRDAIRRGDATEEMAAEFLRLIQRAELIRDELLRAFYKLNLSIAGRFTN